MELVKEKINVYINEYNLVIHKITSLSLKFSSGSYIIPVSIIASMASIKLDYFFVHIVASIIPIVLIFYIYNHVHYMALQFKLSGYAKHLEMRINKMLDEDILLWENKIARGNGQNYYEGLFLGVSYLCILAITYYVAYAGLANYTYTLDIPYGIPFLVTLTYYFSLFSLVFFLIFFTNEHENTFRNAKFFYSFKYDKNLKPKKNFFAQLRKKIIKHAIVVIIILLFPFSLLPLMYLPPSVDSVVNKEYEYIVVLGNKSEDGIPSADMKDRLNCLISCIKEYRNSIIVLSGGNGEAELMKNYLLDKGYIDLLIIMEEKSLDTRENLINISSVVSEKTLIITSDYHVFRTNLINNKMGLKYDIIGASSSSSIFLKSIKECYISYFELLFGHYKT